LTTENKSPSVLTERGIYFNAVLRGNFIMVEKKLYNQLHRTIYPLHPKRISAGVHNGRKVFMIGKNMSEERRDLNEQLRKQIRRKRELDRSGHIPIDGKESYERMFGKMFKTIAGCFR